MDLKIAVKQTAAFATRNIRLYFKDKGFFILSLISPLIMLGLYILFLDGILKDSFETTLKQAGDIKLVPEIVNGLIASFEVSSIIAVSSVTVAFTVNMTMADDKVSGVRSDLLTSPVRQSVLTVGYFISTAFVTLVICLVALAAGLIYIAASGWAMSAGDCFLAVADTVLCVLFGTSLSSLVCVFLKSRGAISAVSTIVSVVYGFICGAYYPVSQFAPAIQNVVMLLPGTYGTGLLRTHFMLGYIDKLTAAGVPATSANAMLDGLDGRLFFFGGEVPVWAMYLIIIGAIALFIGAFVAVNVLLGRRGRSRRKNDDKTA